jgi:thymidylate synthase
MLLKTNMYQGTFDAAWLPSLWWQIEQEGRSHASRMGPTYEMLDATLTFNSYSAPYRPGISRRLGLVEMLQVFSAYFDERHLKQVAPNLKYQYTLTHAYGIKIAQQLPKVIEQLCDNHETRRAMLYIGKPEDGFEVDRPCMQLVQFQIRDGLLYTSVYARSWDVLSGLPYDVLVLNGLAQLVAHFTTTAPLRTTFHVGSLHLYHEVLDQIRERHAEKFSIGANPFGQYFKVTFPNDWDDMRNWAMDELNRIDEWEHGLPKGVSYDNR